LDIYIASTILPKQGPEIDTLPLHLCNNVIIFVITAIFCYIPSLVSVMQCQSDTGRESS